MSIWHEEQGVSAGFPYYICIYEGDGPIKVIYESPQTPRPGTIPIRRGPISRGWLTPLRFTVVVEKPTRWEMTGTEFGYSNAIAAARRLVMRRVNFLRRGGT
jgi:hypothetical protein